MNISPYRFGFSENQGNPSRIMDQMDIDRVPDVPDTPDRLTAQEIKGKSSGRRCSNLSISGNRNSFDGLTRTQFKVNDNGSGKCSMGTPKSAIISSDHHSSDFVSGNPSYSNNPSFFRRMKTDEIHNHERINFQPRKTDRSVYVPSSADQDGCLVDLTERHGHNGLHKNVFPRGAPASNMGSSSITSCFVNKGKEPKDTISGFDRGNVVNCTQLKAGKVASTSLGSTRLPRATGQKRLVRNGCISPHNIAKAKQSVVMDNDGLDGGANHTVRAVSSSPQIPIGKKEWIGEDLSYDRTKGKGVMKIPSSVKKPDAQSAHPPSRNPVVINEVVNEVSDTNGDAGISFEELSGWRNTRNRSKKSNLPCSRENSSIPRDSPGLNKGLPWHMVERGETGSATGTSHSNPLALDATSSRDASLPFGEQRTSHVGSQVGQFNRHSSFAKSLSKRQRQGFASSSHGECSRAAMDNSDVILLGSPENNAGQPRTSGTVSQNSFHSLEPVIEIDETNPEVRGDGSSNVGSNSNDAGDMARQIEADEMLARELQEQLYNEAPGVGVGEIDAHVALALQHGEDLSPIFPRSRAFHARNSSTTSSSRQSQSSSALGLLRRGSQARAASGNRMARLRNRFPGRPRTISSSGERNPVFPADMDVDLRMYILETLEAINDMGVANGFLQTQRDFNENDYEMLLALDENNHQHGGASTAQINGLPQSTVQSDNLEEACAICLETPSLGDTIRHLPCLHKFHKDCIDPWLRRRRSCPVCKSSII
ncbi:uncharacterized protein [Coffea arabica]|uniref:Uncharacterized protein isoform X1 n=2 Tax=Coffea arabica TaxID=13443 RepID=A0A6P6WZQ0_COFAR|nr:E3 ubiquitin-protein ligase RLIM-like isoform X1 [Coffea arabica]